MSNFEFYEQDNNCILCGSDQLHTFKAEAFDSKKPSLINIRECKDCFFAWQTHISRSKEESIKYFEDAYSDKGEQKSKYFDTNVKQKIGQLEFNFIDKLPIEEKTLLDIGAGDGMFAKIAANRNWNVTSVDPAIDEHKFHNSTTINSTIAYIEDARAIIPKSVGVNRRAKIIVLTIAINLILKLIASIHREPIAIELLISLLMRIFL